MLGASGAVGGEAAQALSRMPQVQRLTLLNRRPLQSINGPNTVQHQVDVLTPQSYDQHLPGHSCAICCLGVGQPSKVSTEEFIRIDKTAVIDFAIACKLAGVGHFQLLAAVGADTRASTLYLRTKGELQVAITALGFQRVSFFQPSMILTPTNRYGLGQAVLLTAWPWLTPLLQAGWQKYRGIRVETLGLAIAKNVATTGRGVETLHWPQFQVLVAS
jgi:uncharacterized protein YbjT (DUF2867 family)